MNSTEYEEFYQQFKEYWINDETISKRKVFNSLGENYASSTKLVKYVNKRLKEEELPLKHKSGGRPKGIKNGQTSASYNDLDKKYEEFLEYFFNTNLSQADILEQMGTTNGTMIHKHIQKRLKEDNLSVKDRFREIKSKEMKEYVKNKRITKWKNNYEIFKDYWINTDLNKKEIYHEMGVSPEHGLGEYVNNKLKEDNLPVRRQHYRKMDGQKLNDFYELIKDDWYNSDLSLSVYLKEYYNVGPSTKYFKYCLKCAKNDGLIIGKLKAKDILSDDDLENFYQEIRDDWSNSDLSLTDYFKINKVSHFHQKFNYCKKRLEEDKLLYNNRNIKNYGKIRYKNEGYVVYIGNYYIGTYNDYDAAEKVLGFARENIFLGEDKIKELKDKYPSRPKNTKIKKKINRERKYGKDVNDAFVVSKDLLDKFYIARNISDGTKKGYDSAILIYLKVTKASSLSELINKYSYEEDNNVPIRKSTLRADLINYRSYIINKDFAAQSVRKYFSDIKTLLRHFDLTIPQLPQIKLKQGYVANYNDLPTHDMIKTACEQVDLFYKSIILFMSSSGTAKAETLSITVGMFLKGFKGLYFDDEITEDSIYELLTFLKDKNDLVPLIYLKRIKTDKYYFACCSPEASQYIIDYLLTREDLKLDSKLFNITSAKLQQTFIKINDDNNWGFVGPYRRFRSHTLRKFMASNIKLARDYVDALQGRSKDKIGEAYFKQDPKELREIYINHMHNVMIYQDKKESIEITQIQPKSIKDDDLMDVSDKLVKYSELQKEGFLTMEEFNKIKEKLLAEVI